MYPDFFEFYKNTVHVDGQGVGDPLMIMAYLGFWRLGGKKNSREEMGLMSGFCLQFDNLVMAGELSGGPNGYLSCKLNSELTPLDGMGLEATEGCQAPRPLGRSMDSLPRGWSLFFPPGFPTFISHDSPSWNLTCAALIPFPCESSEIWLPQNIPKANHTVQRL